MRRNNFSSAADRRWQRRYERIQQRKEEERERRERTEDYYEAYYPSCHDIDIHSVIQSAPTVTVTMPTFDEPNLNGTVITREAWESAMAEFSETTADTRQRELAQSIGRIARGEADEADSSRIYSYLQEEIYREFTRAAEQYRRGEEIHEQAVRERPQGRGYRVQNMVVDDFCGFTFKNGGEIIFHDLDESQEPEQELEAGDASALDAFLGEFLAPGA